MGSFATRMENSPSSIFLARTMYKHAASTHEARSWVFTLTPAGSSTDSSRGRVGAVVTASGRARAFSCNHDLTERSGVMVRHPALLVACSLPFLSRGFAQGPQIITLTIQTQNRVQYRYDLTDPLKVGTEASVTAWRPNANFSPFADISDITEINGKPARGMVVLRGMGFNVTRDAQAGQAIADSPGRGAVFDGHFDILDDEGRPVGSITSNGIAGGPPAPGLPPGLGTLTITGGTGAFLGAK